MKPLLLFICLLFAGSSLKAQHCPNPPVPPVGCSSCSPVTPGMQIPECETYEARSGRYANVALNGGLLYVNGTVTLSEFDFNGGYIVILPGSKLVVPDNFIVNGVLINYGTLQVQGNMTVLPGSCVFNKSVTNSTALIEVLGTLVYEKDSYVFNDGGEIRAGTIDDRGVIGCQQNGGLPVQYAYLRAESTDYGTVNINWATLEEKNSRSFVVERAAGNLDFQPIGESIAARGESQKFERYVFTDNNPRHGFNYYRIRQIDADGSVQISRAVRASVEGGLPDLRIVGNPVSESLRYQINTAENSPVEVKIFNTFGLEVNRASHGATPSRFVENAVPMTGLAPGLYFVKIEQDGIQRTAKVIKE